jgi:RHS repeat-associated protein
MTSMPHLQQMEWDFEDQLHSVEKGSEKIYYVYDAAGQRMRKVVEKNNNGALIEERIYIGGFEVFRQSNGSGLKLERETLHLMDDKQRIALVETRTQGNDPAPPQLIRYQFGNHLGSASLELDDQAQIISYEESTPYGSTSYQAVRSQTETPKRYRFTGKERDEESGLYYYGVRYYACWLGRWTSADPAGLIDGPALYNYTKGNPVALKDPSGRQTFEDSEEQERNLETVAQSLAGIGEGGSEFIYGPTIGRRMRRFNPAEQMVFTPQRTPTVEAVPPIVPFADATGRRPDVLEAVKPLQGGNIILEHGGQRVTGTPGEYLKMLMGGSTLKPGVQVSQVQAVEEQVEVYSGELGDFTVLAKIEASFDANRQRIETVLQEYLPTKTETLPVHPSELPAVRYPKAVASTSGGPTTISGYSASAGVPGVYNASLDVWQRSFEIGHRHRPTGGPDRGVYGLFYASHAERQAYMLGCTRDVTVSMSPCADCQNWFRLEAIAKRHNIRVHEPSATWTFSRRGQVWVAPLHNVNPHPVLRSRPRR